MDPDRLRDKINYFLSTVFRGMDPDDPANSGMTALMVACETGRAHNVELLLARATASE